MKKDGILVQRIFSTILILLIIILICFIVFLLEIILFPSPSFAPGKASCIPILIYHNISNDDRPSETTISSKAFKEQMEWLSQNGYTTITGNKLLNFITKNSSLPEKSVMITFDDGYRNILLTAFPLMKKLGFNGVVFIITDGIMNMNNTKQIEKLTFRDMNHTQGTFEIGSHTHNLHKINSDGNSILLNITENEILSDINHSILLTDAFMFAYPYGQKNQKIKNVLHTADIKLAFTSEPKMVKFGDDPFELGRYTIDGNMNLDDFKKIFENIGK